MNPQEVDDKLAAFLQREHGAKSVRIENVRLLTGGASRQTWSFDATIDGEKVPLIARADSRTGPGSMPRETEYRLLEAAAAAGVPVPRVHLMGDDSFGTPFFLMERVEGETIARRILRDDAYAEAREKMTAQLGDILAAVHRIPPSAAGLAGLPRPAPGKTAAETELDRWEQVYRAMTPDPHPAYELAIRWLRDGPPAAEPALVHGDFRMGNLIVGEAGVRAVLDWELAHIGDPMEDLGWVSVRSWRFGNEDLPVAGVGGREEFFRAYEAAGGRPVDPAAVHWWEVFGNLRWGIICIMQARNYLDGVSRSVELASIGRRTAETEWELMRLTAR
jgi:aminoglycoside phosphotransferase (APT) family kinase protein